MCAHITLIFVALSSCSYILCACGSAAHNAIRCKSICSDYGKIVDRKEIIRAAHVDYNTFTQSAPSSS
jgi:non-homologous end joining protein Ku